MKKVFVILITLMISSFARGGGVKYMDFFAWYNDYFRLDDVPVAFLMGQENIGKEDYIVEKKCYVGGATGKFNSNDAVRMLVITTTRNEEDENISGIFFIDANHYLKNINDQMKNKEIQDRIDMLAAIIHGANPNVDLEKIIGFSKNTVSMMYQEKESKKKEEIIVNVEIEKGKYQITLGKDVFRVKKFGGNRCDT